MYARLILPGVLLACIAAITACATESGRSAGQDLEVEAQGIHKSLMCPICPSETIDQSQTEIANQMRRTVREKLAEGESRGDILQFFVERYGQEVLAEPPKSGFNLLVWLAPPLALLLGGGALAMVVRAMRHDHRRSAEATTSSVSGLEPYLSAVDRDIRRMTVDEGGVNEKG